jgi:hypothetical protein
VAIKFILIILRKMLTECYSRKEYLLMDHVCVCVCACVCVCVPFICLQGDLVSGAYYLCSSFQGGPEKACLLLVPEYLLNLSAEK